MDFLPRALDDLSKMEGVVLRLEAQLRQAKDELTKLRHFIEMHDRYSPRTASKEVARAPLSEHRPVSATIRNWAYAYLSTRAYGVQTSEIADALAKDGLELKDTDRVNYISSILSRDDRFENVKPHGWFIAGREKAEIFKGTINDASKALRAINKMNFDFPKREKESNIVRDGEKAPSEKKTGMESLDKSGMDDLDDDIPF